MPKKKGLTDAPETLEKPERKKLVEWVRKKVDLGDLPPHYKNIPEIRRKMEECLRWHVMNGVQRVNWYATVQNWVVQGAKFEGWKPRGGVKPKTPEFKSRELPQEPRTSDPRGMQQLQDAIKQMNSDKKG